MEGLEIVAAFVDGERVDGQALKAALSEPEARDYLADLVALREVMEQSNASPASMVARPSRRWLVAAAAAVILSLGGGYALGLRGSAATDTVAPQPTRVIEVAPGTSYAPQGGR
jgi:hypothetical protein